MRAQRSVSFTVTGGALVRAQSGADKRDTILCGYHELRRLMRPGAAERALRATAGSGGSGGPGGWW